MQLWPSLRALADGELTSDQLRWLIDTLGLADGPRTEGPGAAKSIAHRSFTDDTGARLVLDLARVGDGETGWVMALFFRSGGGKPSAGTVEGHRRLFRDVIDRLGLTIVEITPAATADEVFTVPEPPDEVAQPGVPPAWNLPYDTLEDMWPHLGLAKDAPREVKEVKLRELMRRPVWSAAPETLRREAEQFLQGG